MIKWCAYCQSYMGESAPFEKHSLTHGLCRDCADKGLAMEPDAGQRLRPLANYFRDIRKESLEGVNTPALEWITKGLELGIKPPDLLIGILQPLLYEIGELWSKGDASVATEHRLSSFAEALTSLLYARCPELEKNRQSRTPDILLTNADGNYHTLGIKFLEMRLLSTGFKTFTALPGLPAAEILGLAKTLGARAIGVSVSLLPQMKSIRELAGEILKLPEPERPKLILGGMPIKEGLVLPPELKVVACADITKLHL